ncbi:HNH endonuclease [Aquisphaera insulae]|uniref:HNH endonuclease n=1 Tax=Aquisphaera insulae TaxID=2712864 RepID=UPI0013E9F529|nr:HNH endonuclease signature motif containing protein [Aquisphaera insulae]
MNDALRGRIRRRARYRCEYCRLPQSAVSTRHQIEHVIAEQHRGDDDESNLALACTHCNLHKGPNIAGRDPLTEELCRLYHPRSDRWSEHFAWEGPRLIGLTPVGRTTVQVLDMNDPLMVETREALIQFRRFKP